MRSLRGAVRLSRQVSRHGKAVHADYPLGEVEGCLTAVARGALALVGTAIVLYLLPWIGSGDSLFFLVGFGWAALCFAGAVSFGIWAEIAFLVTPIMVCALYAAVLAGGS